MLLWFSSIHPLPSMHCDISLKSFIWFHCLYNIWQFYLQSVFLLLFWCQLLYFVVLSMFLYWKWSVNWVYLTLSCLTFQMLSSVCGISSCFVSVDVMWYAHHSKKTWNKVHYIKHLKIMYTTKRTLLLWLTINQRPSLQYQWSDSKDSLSHIKDSILASLDPYQFVYRANGSTEDDLDLLPRSSHCSESP